MNPLISAIMPTRARPNFAARAVENWRAQSYAEKELVIVDDGDAPSFAEAPKDEAIFYLRITPRLTIGTKRNIACERARGEIIAHFDDDDQYSSTRLVQQIALLQQSGKAVCGYCSGTFEEIETGRRWLYTGSPDYGIGASLMYLRSWWAANRFLDESVGEDNWMVRRARAVGQIVAMDGTDMAVYACHPGNTSVRPFLAKDKTRAVNGAQWRLIAS